MGCRGDKRLRENPFSVIERQVLLNVRTAKTLPTYGILSTFVLTFGVPTSPRLFLVRLRCYSVFVRNLEGVSIATDCLFVACHCSNIVPFLVFLHKP